MRFYQDTQKKRASFLITHKKNVFQLLLQIESTTRVYKLLIGFFQLPLFFFLTFFLEHELIQKNDEVETQEELFNSARCTSKIFVTLLGFKKRLKGNPNEFIWLW